MLGQPESPRWLVQKNRRQDAEESARRLWGSEGASQLGETSTSGTLPCLAGSACCDTPQLGEHASTVIYPRYWLYFYSCHHDQCIAAPSTRLCWCMEEIVATPPQAACSECMHVLCFNSVCAPFGQALAVSRYTHSLLHQQQREKVVQHVTKKAKQLSVCLMFRHIANVVQVTYGAAECTACCQQGLR